MGPVLRLERLGGVVSLTTGDELAIPTYRTPEADSSQWLGSLWYGEWVDVLRTRRPGASDGDPGSWVEVRTVDGSRRGWIRSSSVREHVACSKASYKEDVIWIAGSLEYIDEIEAALRLLERKAPRRLEYVAGFLSRVAEAGRSRVNASTGEAGLVLSSIDRSVAYCAGSLAHEARHCELPGEFSDWTLDVSPESAATLDELAALAVQQEVLVELGASAEEIAWIAAADGTHWDADHDGRLTMNDWIAQDW